MAEPVFRYARVEDAEPFAAVLRPDDRIEVEAIWGPGRSADAIAVDIERAKWAILAEDEGEIIAMWAVREKTVLGGVAIPWCLTGTGIERHTRLFARSSMRWVQQIRTGYDYLEHMIDARHTVSIRWLQWLGFTIDTPQAVGLNGEIFYRSHMRGRC